MINSIDKVTLVLNLLTEHLNVGCKHLRPCQACALLEDQEGSWVGCDGEIKSCTLSLEQYKKGMEE